MTSSTGWVLAAGAIEVANEALTAKSLSDFNLRLIPATAAMALVLGLVEKLAPAFGSGLGMLVLLSVLVIPYGNAPTPIENFSKILGYSSKAV
jgi:hypothetical protein